jgi:hypothetical protein
MSRGMSRYLRRGEGRRGRSATTTRHLLSGRGRSHDGLVPGDNLSRVADESEATEGAEGVRAVGLGVGLAGYAAFVGLA